MLKEFSINHSILDFLRFICPIYYTEIISDIKKIKFKEATFAINDFKINKFISMWFIKILSSF